MSFSRCLVCLTLLLLLSAGSQSRLLIEKRNLNNSMEDLRQYLNEEAEKIQNGQLERTSPGGPDPQHHFINNYHLLHVDFIFCYLSLSLSLSLEYGENNIKMCVDLRQYLNGEAKKNQNGQVERTGLASISFFMWILFLVTSPPPPLSLSLSSLFSLEYGENNIKMWVSLENGGKCQIPVRYEKSSSRRTLGLLFSACAANCILSSLLSFVSVQGYVSTKANFLMSRGVFYHFGSRLVTAF
ncbi:Uncharacterized protein TCM_043338 [Theobroma cacao]|uniref:Uncharacterized protein n=1 Tax=Theobroma cacao TaxID=3641 RepID=A0A061FNE7_THECC|nr:Uncharacterized protein TCM_043338 [Theobroma cacao]